MLGEEGRRRILERPEGDRGIKPDFVVLEGWPANAPLPTEPTTAWRGENGHTRAVKLHIGEVGFCSDLEHTAKYEAKAAHYAPLAEELTSAGWQVHHTIHVLTVGVRATVPLRNLEVLEGLQMPKKDREELQSPYKIPPLFQQVPTHGSNRFQRFQRFQRFPIVSDGS